MVMSTKIKKDIITEAKETLKKQVKEKGLVAQPPAVTLNVVQKVDADGELYNDGAINFKLDFVREGGLAEIKPTAFKLLFALASCMDEEGFTFASQQTLADIVGLKDRRQVAQIIKNELLDKQFAGRTLLIGDMFVNPKTNKPFYLYHLVNAELAFEAYVPDDEDIILDDDIDSFLDADDAFEENDTDSVVDKKEKEEASPTADDAEDSLFIMPVIVEDEEQAPYNNIRLENENVTDKDNTEEDNTMTEDIFKDFLEDAREFKDAPDIKPVEKAPEAKNVVKFKRGKETAEAKANAGAKRFKSESIDADNDKALALFGL